MNEYSIWAMLAKHPWLVAGLIVLCLIILLIPYEVVRDSRGGIRSLQIRALVWTWEHRPGYSRLHLPGLLRLQHAVLRGVRTLWGLVRERFLAGIIEMLRRWLG